MSNVKVFKFTRGENYSVDVAVSERDSFSFHNVVSPEGASVDVMEKFLYDAEVAAMKAVFEEEEQVGGV